MKIHILALSCFMLLGVSLAHAGGDLDVSQFNFNNDGNGQMEASQATGTSMTDEDAAKSNLAAASEGLGSRGFRLFLLVAAVIMVISLLVWIMKKSSVPTP